eukprot:5004583-Alexandrium_andersonii.AAC.1
MQRQPGEADPAAPAERPRSGGEAERPHAEAQERQRAEATQAIQSRPGGEKATPRLLTDTILFGSPHPSAPGQPVAPRPHPGRFA